MALYTFRLPDIGEGIAEAEIVAWHVQPGDTVGEDSPLADMMTDKATVEMESPVAGRVVSIAGEVGDRIPIGSMLVEIEVAGEVGEGASTGSARTEPEHDEPAPVRPEPVEGRLPDVEVAQGASTSSARTETRQ